MIPVSAYSLLPLAQGEPAAQPVSIQTALLLILGIALVLAVTSLRSLHQKVEKLATNLHLKRSHPSAATHVGPPPEVIAVIAAAVHESFGTDHRIVSISTENHASIWSMEGRRQIFGSRRTR